MMIYRSIAIPTAKRPPMLNASPALIADALEELVDLAPEDVVLELEELEELVPLLMDPSVPLETALPGRLTVALAASAWKLARERVELALVL